MNTPAMPMADTLPWFSILTGGLYGGMAGAGLGRYLSSDDKKERFYNTLKGALAGGALGAGGGYLIGNRFRMDEAMGAPYVIGTPEDAAARGAIMGSLMGGVALAPSGPVAMAAGAAGGGIAGGLGYGALKKAGDYMRLRRMTTKKAAVNVDLNIGDTILTGRFRNVKKKVKTFGKDKNNQPTVNGRSMFNFRIEKLMPDKDKKSNLNGEDNMRYAHDKVAAALMIADKIAVTQKLYNAALKSRISRQIAGFGTNPGRVVNLQDISGKLKNFVLKNRDMSALKALSYGPVTGSGNYKGLFRNINIRNNAAVNMNNLTAEALSEIPWHLRPLKMVS